MAGAIPASERNALLALHQSTGGAGWADSSGWLGAPGTECSWYGVTCNDAGTSVVAISMGSNGLAGPLPPAFGDLPNLRDVYLGENEITGPLPSDLGRLANLESLNLHRNLIGGPIPSAIGNLKKLKVLSLFLNEIDGAIPPAIGGATALEDLALFANRLSGPIPAEIGNLTNLVSFDAAGNALTGSLPASIGSLPALEVLRLSDNQIGGTLPATLGSLPSIREIIVSYNALSGPIPPSLGDLSTLELLELTENALTGAVPSQLGALRNLKNLHLDANALSGTVPSALGGLERLESLRLGWNALTGAIPPELAAIDTLVEFSLPGNGLTGGVPPQLGGAAGLRVIDLSSNALTGPIPAELGNLAELEFLGFDANALSGPIPPSLGNATRLQEVFLGANRLTGTIPDSFANLTELRSLWLHANELTGPMPAWIGQLTHLEDLTLGDNDLTGPIPASLTALASLNYLDLGRNRLTGSIPADIGNLRELEYLTLEDNLLDGPLPSSFWQLTRLVDVRLSNLDLTGTIPPEVGDLEQVNNLSFQNNRLSGTIPREIGDIETVEYLDLAGNHFTGTIPPEIGKLTNVLELDLSRNALRGQLPSELMNLASLQGLDLGQNALVTSNASLRAFVDARHAGGDFAAMQTVTPAGLRITSVTDRSLVAAWDPIAYVFDPGGYRLEASTSPGGPPVAIATTATKDITTATIRGLAASTTYFVTVAAVTHPNGFQRNVVASDRSAAVSATTSQAVVAPAEVAVTAAPKGLVQIDGEPAGTDSFAVTNFGDVATSMTVTQEGTFFTLAPLAFTLAPGATQVVTVTSVSGQPPGNYWGAVFAEGVGVPDDFYVPVTLLSASRPAGTVVAEALTTRIELSGEAGSESVGSARFRNIGTATLTGVLLSDVPWIEVPNEALSIEAGSVGTINFTIVRARRPPGDGALTGTLRLVYIAGAGEAAAARVGPRNGSVGVSTTVVTVIDVLKPQTGSSAIPALLPGEIALFAPGLLSAQGTSRLVSDVAIANSYGAGPVTDLRAYYAAAGASQVAVASLGSIGSSTSVTLANVVPTVFGSTATQTGTLQFRSRDWRNLVLQGMLLGLASNAPSTVGETPIFRSDRSLGPGQSGHLTGLVAAPPMTTDIHVQETAGAAAAARIEFRGSDGAAIGQPLEVALEPFGSIARPDAVPAGAVTAVVTHSGTGGAVVAYGRIVAGPEGDRWTSVDWGRANGFARGEAARIPLVESSSGATTGGRRRLVGRPGGTGPSASATGSGTATALWLFNPEEEAAIVRLELVEAGGGRSHIDVTVLPGRTQHLEDVVRSVRGSAGRGSLRIVPLRGGIVAAARTVRTRDGAFASASALPIVRDTAGLRLGQVQRFPALEDPAAPTIEARTPGTLRTGLGLIETSGEAATVRISLLLHDGRSPVSQRIVREFRLEAHDVFIADRMGRALFGETRDQALPDLHDLQIDLQVVSGGGSILPFVVVTDNASGDALVRID